LAWTKTQQLACHNARAIPLVFEPSPSHLSLGAAGVALRRSLIVIIILIILKYKPSIFGERHSSRLPDLEIKSSRELAEFQHAWVREVSDSSVADPLQWLLGLWRDIFA